MRGTDMPRLWLLRLAQLPLAHSAPHECRQYYTGNNGTIKTFNYAVNGRYLADQKYKACVRRNKGICSIRYAPCDHRSFRIGSQGMLSQNDMVEDGMMPVNEVQTQEDEMEGSGADPQIAPPIQPTPVPSLASRIWSFIWPSWLWQSQSARTISWNRWSPYAQHYAVPEDDKFRYSGYGNFGAGRYGLGRQGCKDRITIPCENEYFLSNSFMSGVCDPHHCGSSFCPGTRPEDCHVVTSISPFAVAVNFGPPAVKSNPEENIGACLKYTQMPCET